MRHRDISWTVALCLSLGIHAGIIRWRAEAYVAANNPVRLMALNRIAIINSISPLVEPEDVGRLGDEKGTGYATDASPGELELLARKGEQDQSYLSRDPQSLGQASAAPSQSRTPPGENGANGSRSAQEESQSQSTNHPFGVQQTQQAKPVFKTPRDPQPGPAPAPQRDPPPEAQRVQTAMAQQSAASPASVTSYRAPSGRPGPPDSAANPAPQGESDSDPFSVTGSLEFRPGSTKVQMGRKHKITRPRLSWDTVYDFEGMTSASVVLELQLDETGHVRNSEVIKSSGSSSIDEPCKLASYSWWFEPAKDAAGQPIKDVIKFTIKFF
jgi:TonB family protein